MGGKPTVTIRIEPEVKAAIDMVAAEISAKMGIGITQSQAIWDLVERGAPNIAQRIAEISDNDRVEEIKSGKRSPKRR